LFAQRPQYLTRASGDGRNVADVNRALAGVADWRDEMPLRGDHRLECQETLKVQVGAEERETDIKLADPSFDRRLVAKKTYRYASSAAN
jgi:hypothetical protein